MKNEGRLGILGEPEAEPRIGVRRQLSGLSALMQAAAAAKSCQSCPTLCNPIDGSPAGSRPWDSPGKNTGVGCHFLLQCMKLKSEGKSLSRVRFITTPWTVAHQAPPSMGFPRQAYWSGLPLPSPLMQDFNIKCLITPHLGLSPSLPLLKEISQVFRHHAI